jgi:hypothetical protein
MPKRAGLLRLLLLLLTDADLELSRLCFLERFVIVPVDCISQILIDIDVFGKNCHQRKGVITRWAEGPEPFNVRNCHT